MAEIEEQLKSLLMRVKEEREKFNSQKTKIMAFGPIPSWQTEGGKVKAVTDFIFLGSKSMRTVTIAMNLKDTCSLKEMLWQI